MDPRQVVPPPPPGFTLDDDVPPPPGFVLEGGGVSSLEPPTSPGAPLPVQPPQAPLAERVLKGYVKSSFPSMEGVGNMVGAGAELMNPALAVQEGSIIRQMIDAARQGASEQWGKAKEAATTGHPFQAIGRAAAAAVPGVGPAVAESVERLGSPDTRPEAAGELAGVVASPLNFLPFSKLGKGTRITKAAGKIESGGYAGIARALAPDAPAKELKVLAGRAPVLHAAGTTRGMPNLETLQHRVNARLGQTGDLLEDYLASPQGEIRDIGIGANRAKVAERVTKSQIPDIEGTQLTITPKEFKRLPPAQKRAIMAGQDEATLENLITDDPVFLDDPLDVTLHAAPVSAAIPELNANARALRGVTDEAARADVAAGDLGRNASNMLSRRQATTVRRVLDRESRRYAKTVPATPGPATSMAAYDTQSNALRHTINEADPRSYPEGLGALNTDESAHLVAQDAIQETMDKLTGGGLSGERFADIRGLSNMARAGLMTAAGTGAGAAAGGIKGAVVGGLAAATLPIAYRIVTSTPLRLLRANTRLAISKAILRGDLNTATRLASSGLIAARTSPDEDIREKLIEAANNKNARLMKGIE